ncbi:MAG: molybdenum cofactor biosynthesis protein MoeB, partial [Deltaproteobacteria bacterium]|nr:molybdenum cofactor biosynthesis protein MoeB [Deltaproteobacteria bacterium]
REIVCHCHHGGRSARAVAFLKERGFKRAKNLTGGIHEWAEKIDSSLPKY